MAEERCWGECGGKNPAETPQGLCRECLTKLGPSSGALAGQSGIPTSATPPAGFIPPDPSELAEQFPQLEILELLGQGGMGAVYKARQKHLDRLVALKILPPRIGQTQAFADRFVREARSLARLNDQHIVSIYDFGHTDAGLYYFIMEFVDGTDLRRMIHTGQLAASEALEIICQVCDALQYAHDEGIVHRDVKPENILLNKKGQAKIADFGLAKLVGRPATGYTLTQAGQTMGTPHYMAPEQIERPNQVDHRADIYSLGVVLYEMLTGELPLGRFPPPSQKATVDVRLDTVVLRTLEKEPERRYQHVSELKTAMETITSGGHIVTPRDSVADEAFESVRQRLRRPATGLKIAGLTNCITAIPMLIAWIVLAVTLGVGSAGAMIVGIAGLVYASMGILTLAGAQRMTRLQAYGLAVAAGVIQLIPSPGFILGLWMGIWALVVLTRDEVHRAFVEVTETGDVGADSAIGKMTLSVLAIASSFIFLLALVKPPGHGHLHWSFLLFGPLVVILDVCAFGRWTGRTQFGPAWLWGRIKAEAERIIGRKQPQDTDKPDETRRMAIISFALGLFGVVLSSLRMAFTFKLTFVFLSALSAIFLGLTVLKITRPYKNHLLDAGLAAGGIIAAAISILALLAG